MPQWALLLIGVALGLVLVGGALAWAFRPRSLTAPSIFPPATGEARDPTPGGSQWSGDGGI